MNNRNKAGLHKAGFICFMKLKPRCGTQRKPRTTKGTTLSPSWPKKMTGVWKFSYTERTLSVSQPDSQNSGDQSNHLTDNPVTNWHIY